MIYVLRVVSHSLDTEMPDFNPALERIGQAVPLDARGRWPPTKRPPFRVRS
jgi:hypothetical protein